LERNSPAAFLFAEFDVFSLRLAWSQKFPSFCFRRQLVNVEPYHSARVRIGRSFCMARAPEAEQEDSEHSAYAQTNQERETGALDYG
jgi:hypothetical protein